VRLVRSIDTGLTEEVSTALGSFLEAVANSCGERVRLIPFAGKCGEFRLDAESVLSPSVDSGGGLRYMDESRGSMYKPCSRECQ